MYQFEIGELNVTQEMFLADAVLLELLEKAFQEALAKRRAKNPTASPELVAEDVRSDVHIALGRAFISKVDNRRIEVLTMHFSAIDVERPTATELAMHILGIG